MDVSGIAGYRTGVWPISGVSDERYALPILVVMASPSR